MKTIRFRLIALAAACLMGTTTAQADDYYDGPLYVAPMGSYVLADGARNNSDAYGGTLAVGKYFRPGWELELLGTYLNYGGKTASVTQPCGLLGLATCTTDQAVPGTTVYAGGVGANAYLFNPKKSYADGLFLHADVMGGSTTLFNLGLGYDLPLGYTFGGMLPSGLALRVEALYHLDPGHKDLNGNDRSYNEAQFNLGLRIPLGGPPKHTVPPPPPQPVQVVPVQQPPAPPPPPPPPCEAPAAGEPINLAGCKTGDTIVLHGVNFNFNKSTLTVNAKALLDQVADALKARSDIKVEIDGHTDSIGAASYNQKLSERRAASVKLYLVDHGIDAGRMTTKGFGESKPIASNKTAEGRELNRRVELKITDSKTEAGPAPATATPPPTTDLGNAPPQEEQAPEMPPAAAKAQTPAATAPPNEAPAPTPPPSEAPASPEAAVPAPADDQASAVGGSATVTVHDYMFSPQTITVTPGTTVTWTNDDASTHQPTFADGQSKELPPHASYSRTFNQPGTYPYHCGIHSYMKGTVVVKAP